jgi:hypothetical protein
MNTDKNVHVQQQTFQAHTGDVEPSNLDHCPAHLSVCICVHLWFQILACFNPIEDRR